MKFKVLFLLAIISLVSFNANAQRGVRIGYIDTEYILQNVPEYQQASAQLDKKVLQWKSEIEKRLSVIEQKKKDLENESVLLTKELYKERFDDIAFEEAEILDYQQKRFGPNGDLFIQKKQLMQPVQDQIMAAVQEIAVTKKYDMVLDKADVVMLYSADRYDMSEQVLRTITRTSKRQQAKNKKERKALEDEEVVPEVNEEKDERAIAAEEKKAARQKELDDKRAAREAALEERRKQQQELREARKREAEERRKKVLEDRNKAKAERENAKTEKENDTTSVVSKEAVKKEGESSKEKETPEVNAKKSDSTTQKAADKPKTTAEILEERRQQKAKDREARKKALEDRKKKILEDRKKAREARLEKARKNDSIAKSKKAKEGENNDN